MKGVLFHHDNAPAHKSVVAMAAVHDCGFELVDHPPQGSRQKFSYTWCKMNKCHLAKKLHMVLINLHLVLAILFGLQCVLKV